MRYINNSSIISRKWKVASDGHLIRLNGLNNTGRKTYMDQNTDWNVLKKSLERLGNYKCWFSEAHPAVSHLAIEHFRPKKQVHLIRTIEKKYQEERIQSCNKGYWWLSYKQSNFRIAGFLPNSKKGSFFPLKKGSVISTDATRSEKNESPLLLDPCIKSDIQKLTFVGTLPIPTNPDSNHIDNVRARISIEVYNLKHNKLKKAKSSVFTLCKSITEQANDNWQDRLKNEGIDDEAFRISTKNFGKNCANLVKFLHPGEPFTRMIICFYQSKKNDWIQPYVLTKARELKYM